MKRERIDENVKRRLYAESMGRCMNPDCQTELFMENGDIIEKAHIVPYCKTADNVFDNLVVLCPNCHTKYDKNSAFESEQVKEWKRIRKEQLEHLFSKKFNTFEEMRKSIEPILLENKSIYENYYLNDEKDLWNKFENQLLVNNKKLKMLLKNNLDLIQSNSEKSYSNLAFVQSFLAHVDEFEATRNDEEKNRRVLFPKEINSMFGIEPVEDSILPLTESLEILIEQLNNQGKFRRINIGIENPYIEINGDKKIEKIFLNDTPRLRQLYFDYKCFRKPGVRLESLNFAFKYIKSRQISFKFLKNNNLREIEIKHNKMIFVYEYCLSKAFLSQLSPERNCIVVNLHNWNGKSCISKEAYELSRKIGIVLLTMDDFYEYINEIK